MISEQNITSERDNELNRDRLYVGETELHMVDMSPPISLEEQDVIVKYVQETDMEVWPSNAFWAHVRTAEEGILSYRVGYHFMFWLLNEDDAARFVEKWNDAVTDLRKKTIKNSRV